MQLNSVHQDGIRGGPWAVLDYGGLMVHIFHEQTRQFYSLDRLWEDAKIMKWEQHTQKAIPLKKIKKKKLARNRK